MRARFKDKPESNAEFLSGFYKTDRIYPVITLVLYFGADTWYAPRAIHDMLDADEALLKFVPDYRINLVAPSEIDDDNFDNFHTELREVLKYIKYSKDKNKLNALVHGDDSYKNISRKTADVINVMTGSNLRYDKGKERVDMCKAIEDMKIDSREEGILEAMKMLIKQGLLTSIQAAETVGMTVSEFEEKSGLNTR